MCEGHGRAKRVPVQFDGFEVGNALVSSDGGVVIFRLNNSVTADEMRERLKGDRTKFISINPRNT